MKLKKHQIEPAQQSKAEEPRQPAVSRMTDATSQKPPIFIHSLFRAGSTYLFQVFRRNPEAFWCYQEPLHELVFFQRSNVHGLNHDHSDAKTKLLRHPRLEKAYFHELIQVWPAWRDTIDEEMIYEAYFDGAHTRMDFWRVLSESAKARPVFQECRTAGRIGPLKKELGGYHIYLWRNPWDQWWSFKVASYFDVAIQMMIRGRNAPAAVAELLSYLKLPTYSGKDLGGACRYYAQRPLNSSHSYLIFYLLWCLGLREGLESADLMLNIDRLSDSPPYRLEVLKKMEDVSIRGIHFDDCAIPQSFYSEKEKAFFGPLEEQVHGWLLAGGWSQKSLDYLLELRRQFDPYLWVKEKHHSAKHFSEQTDRARELAKRLETELAAHANHKADLHLALSSSENRVTQLETEVQAKEQEVEASRLVRGEVEAVRVEAAKTAVEVENLAKKVQGDAEEAAKGRDAFLAALGGLAQELGHVRKEGEAREAARQVEMEAVKGEVREGRQLLQKEMEGAFTALRKEGEARETARQVEMEAVKGEVRQGRQLLQRKMESLQEILVAEIGKAVRLQEARLEQSRVEGEARHVSIQAAIEGRAQEMAEEQKRNKEKLQDLGRYLGQVQDMAVDPWLNYVPAPLSWPILLFKARGIQRPAWFPSSPKPLAPQKPGFWRRLEQSIRKRRKRWIARIGFDREWYLKEYPDVGPSGIDPLDHYVRFGVEKGRWKSQKQKDRANLAAGPKKNRPGFWRRLETSIRKRRKRWIAYWSFDPAWYLEAYPEVRAAGIEPLRHYISYGKKEGRKKRGPERSLAKIIWQALKAVCGFTPLAKVNCSLDEIEGPWWILDAKIQRPLGYWGVNHLRIRVGGREVHLERPGVDTKGIVSFRHLLKLPLGECTIRMDWIEEGMSTQKILEKTCRIRGVSRVDQEKILAHPVDGQTDMTVMPKVGFWRGLEKKIRNHKKAIFAKFNKKFNPTDSEKAKPLLFSFESNKENLGRRLFVDITSIVGSDRLTGVERVTQSVLTGLFAFQTHGMEIIPVHSAENQQGFFVAKPTTLRKGRWERGPDGEVAVQPLTGDVFLGLVLNPHGICENANLLAHWADEGVSILFYVYDLLPIQYPHFWPLEHQTDILHHEWLSIVTSFDEVICISETTAKRCREFLEGKYPPRFPYRNRLERSPVRLGSRKAEISVIPLGGDFVSEPSSRGLPENAEELLQKFRSKPTFLMVGTIEPRKGHRQMLEVFEQIWADGEEVQLLIVGRHGWLMQDFVKGLEEHPENGQRLFWLSEVSDEFLGKIYEASRCLLAASIDEGFGLPLAEAIRHGKPVLARDIEVFRETRESDLRYFQGNLPEITAWIQKICHEPFRKSNDPRQLKNWQFHVRQLREKIQNKSSPRNVRDRCRPAHEESPGLGLLTPHARRIYDDLKKAIESKKRGI